MPTGTPPTSISGFPVTGLCMPAGLAISGNNLYAPHIVDDGGQQLWVLKINKNDGTYTDYSLFGNESVPAVTADGTYLYMSRVNPTQPPQISKRLLTDLTSVADCVYEPWGTGEFIDDGFGNFNELMANPTPALGIVVLGDYIYASHSSDGYNGSVISRINKTTFTLDTSFAGSANGYYYQTIIPMSNPKGLATDGTYLYIANTSLGDILRMNADGTGITIIKDKLTGLKGLTFSGGYLYVSNTSGTVIKIQVSNPSNTTTVVSSGLESPLELAVSGSYIYVANTSDSERDGLITITGFIGRYSDGGGGGGGTACFKEDTKILTDNGYVPVQDLKEGDLVQTIKHGFKPIYLIGKSQILHNPESRTKEALYKCSNNQYPEIFEDLIMTGPHAVLVYPFKEGQEEEVKKFYGRVFVTDKKYRLPVFLDNRASIYECEGAHTIYHIALENENLLMNYGIYANGLLVESCSKTDIKKFF